MSLLANLIQPVSKLLDKAIPDTDIKRKLSHEIAMMAEKSAAEAVKGQLQANIEQAKHPSLFVSGARPAIMWICALGLLTQFFLMPIAEWVTALWYPAVELPNLSTSELTGLTLSLLGLSGMRSWEKSKGVARENMKGKK